MASTRLPGQLIRSGSIPATALGGGVISASAQLATSLPAGAVSSSAQIDYNSITNKLSGVVSSSAQVTPLLPINTISGSTQFNTLTDPFTGSFTGSFTGDGTNLTGIAATLTFSGSTSGTDTLNLKTEGLIFSGSNGITATVTNNTVTLTAPAGTVSASSQVDYNNIQNKLSGVVSSSAQVAPLLPGSTVSSSGQVDITATTNYSTFSSSLATVDATQQVSLTALNTATSSYAINSTIQGQLAGVVSSSTQVKPLLPDGTVTSSAQYPGWITASGQVDYNSITNKLSGVVSSSTQVPPLLPGGTVSSSGQVLLNTVSGTTFSNNAFYFPTDLRVEGNLTAQQIYTEYVSSSVIYESGSTKFGDTTDDVMSVTGSIRVLGGSISGSMTGMFSSSTQVDYNSITNKLSGVVSSSAQVQPLLPGGTVSSSGQVDITATTGYSTFSSSIATKNNVQDVSITALNTATSSYAINSTIQGQLAGVVSSSTQVKPLLPGGTVSSSAQFPGWVTSSTQVVWSSVNYNTGIMSSSAQTVTNLIGQTVTLSGSQFASIVSGSGTAYRLVVPVGTNLYAT